LKLMKFSVEKAKTHILGGGGRGGSRVLKEGKVLKQKSKAALRFETRICLTGGPGR